MFNNLKIGHQIGIGFSLLIIVSALVASSAILGLFKSADGFSEYRSFARESILSGRVQANMLIASNAVQEFLRTRDEAVVESFKERFHAAREFAIEQQNSMDDPRRLQMSQKLVDYLDEYDDKANEAFDLMRRRDVIVQEMLNPQGVRMREDLERIMVSANRDQDTEAAYLAGIALKRVLLGRVHLLRFLDSNESADVIRVRAELGDGFERSYTEMSGAIQDSERQDQLGDFSEARKVYLSAFEEIVTLIHNRNNLVEKQLDPLDRSISETAELIKLSLKDTQDTLGPKVESDNATTVQMAVIGSIFAALLAIFIAWSIIRAVTRPIADLVETVGKVKESGNLSSRLNVQGSNELGTMSTTLNGFLSSLEDKANVAKDVADGKLNSHVELLSGEDTLGQSLQDMLANLKEKDRDTEARDWVRNGQESLNDRMRSVLDRSELATGVLNTLCRHLNAQHGALFIKDNDADTLRFAAGFGGGSEIDPSRVIQIGEGLIGQAAEDRKLIQVNELPDNYATIQSALGDSAPRALLLFPLIYNKRLLAVVELASVRAFPQSDVDFIRTVHDRICVALISAHRQDELRDLLEQTQNQAVELAEAQKSADAANLAKSDFLSNMSHELRTPLNGVLGYVQILQRDHSLNKSQQQSLGSISNCGEHLLNLINDVLDLSKIEAGKMEISLKPTDLSHLIDGVQDIVKPKAEEKGLNFIVKTSPEVPRGIMTDPIKLRQILINLLGNSVKFTPEGSISLRTAEVTKGQLRFEIEDTGMGISEEKLKDIFDPFKQAEGGETEGGTGLGLAISRRIAEALDGSLTATSELDDGSCFTLTLPLVETDEIKEEGFSVTAPHTHTSFSLPPEMKRSVLIADDRETNRDILNQLLTEAGFEAVLVTDGDEAIDILREREFDIILCDVRMPRMNGIEVVKEIRRDPKLKHNLIFAVTASVFPEFREKALDAGFDDFLMKPISVAELAAKMAKAMEIEFVQLHLNEDDDPVADLDPMELFEVLPEDIATQLAHAAKVRNMTKLNEIATTLLSDEATSGAGHHLEGLIVTFNFGGLQEIATTLSPDVA